MHAPTKVTQPYVRASKSANFGALRARVWLLHVRGAHGCVGTRYFYLLQTSYNTALFLKPGHFRDVKTGSGTSRVTLIIPIYPWNDVADRLAGDSNFQRLTYCEPPEARNLGLAPLAGGHS